VERLGSFIVVSLVIGKDIAMKTVEKSTMREIAAAADRTLETVADGVKSMITERPLVTIGMAAGVGILLSLLWRRHAHGRT
jgi:ElaB/YqjD/DUF883 family membrane-anchored ribosome-binding protein